MAATVLFLGLWLGVMFEIGPLRDASTGVYLLLSAVYGYAVNRWWAPLIIFSLAPILAVAVGNGHGQDDASNVAFLELGAVVVVAPVVALGVSLAKFTSWLRARREEHPPASA